LKKYGIKVVNVGLLYKIPKVIPASFKINKTYRYKNGG